MAEYQFPWEDDGDSQTASLTRTQDTGGAKERDYYGAAARSAQGAKSSGKPTYDELGTIPAQAASAGSAKQYQAPDFGPLAKQWQYEQARPGGSKGLKPFTGSPDPTPGAAKTPPLPVPFTQADNLRLQKLQGSLSEVQSQVDNGDLFPHEGEALTQQILQQTQPLRMKQQQAKQQAMQEQQQEVMHAAALQESIEQQHATAQARAFPQTTASFTDPLTGAVEHLYQAKRGEWKPFEFARHEAQKDRENEALHDEPAAPEGKAESVTIDDPGEDRPAAANPDLLKQDELGDDRAKPAAANPDLLKPDEGQWAEPAPEGAHVGGAPAPKQEYPNLGTGAAPRQGPWKVVPDPRHPGKFMWQNTEQQARQQQQPPPGAAAFASGQARQLLAANGILPPQRPQVWTRESAQWYNHALQTYNQQVNQQVGHILSQQGLGNRLDQRQGLTHEQMKQKAELEGIRLKQQADLRQQQIDINKGNLERKQNEDNHRVTQYGKFHAAALAQLKSQGYENPKDEQITDTIKSHITNAGMEHLFPKLFKEEGEGDDWYKNIDTTKPGNQGAPKSEQTMHKQREQEYNRSFSTVAKDPAFKDKGWDEQHAEALRRMNKRMEDVHGKPIGGSGFAGEWLGRMKKELENSGGDMAPPATPHPAASDAVKDALDAAQQRAKAAQPKHDKDKKTEAGAAGTKEKADRFFMK